MSNRNGPKTNSSRKAGARKINSRAMLSSHPPPVVVQPVQFFILRTIATSAETELALNFNNLASLLGIVATGSTTSTYLSSVFRLKRLQIWGPVATAGTPVITSLRLAQSNLDFSSPPKTWSDTSVSFDHPAFVDFLPPKGSLIDKWHTSVQGDQAFLMTFPEGSTIDFHFNFVLNDALALQNGPTLSGATVGTIYHKIVGGLQAVEVNSI